MNTAVWFGKCGVLIQSLCLAVFLVSAPNAFGESSAIALINANFFKLFCILLKYVFEENGHSMTKHDGVRNLHHGSFEVE